MLEIPSLICVECNINLFCLTAIYWKTCLWILNFFGEIVPSSGSLSLCWVRTGWVFVCKNVWVCCVWKKVYIDFLRLFPCYWQFKRGRLCVLLLWWLSELWLLLLMLLLLIIKCWMLSFIVCARVCFFFFPLIFYILYKKKKSFYTLPCRGQQAMGLLSTFYCASLRFLCRICFFYRGEKQLHCQTSLFDIDWNI